MMRELRLLKRIWNQAGLQKALVSTVLVGLRITPDRLRWPQSLWEHPMYARYRVYRELRNPWEVSHIQVLHPPPDLAAAIVRRLRLSHVPAVLLLPDWPGQAWIQEALHSWRNTSRRDRRGRKPSPAIET